MGITIGKYLSDNGFVSKEAAALAETERKEGESYTEALARFGDVSERNILIQLANAVDVRLLAPEMPDADVNAVSLVPREVQERCGILPLAAKDGFILLAVSDPFDDYMKEEVRQITGLSPKFCLCENRYITEGIHYYFSDIEIRLAIEEGADYVRLSDKIINRAVVMGASDIHIEPFDDMTSVRLRIDGAMVDCLMFKPELHNGLISRVKILSGLDIAEHRQPQDGNIHGEFSGKTLDIRVSVMPTIYGEKAVLRILNPDLAVDNADKLGMDSDNYGKMLDILKLPSGVIYFTGPTGSGKTTTLYMLLERLSKKPVNICTIEDPVERRIKRVNQTAVNTLAGMDFGAGLRAALRQDPDIIMLGETRDRETAEISIRAAITGHLVLSTLHTNDSASAVIRLRDMGIEPYLIADSVTAIVAQRLLRKVCPDCAREENPTAEERELIGTGCRYIRRGYGCKHCNFMGYKGRTAIFEVLRVDKTVREMILSGESTSAIYEYAVKTQGMKTLRDSALELARQGIVTPEEVQRAALFAE